MTNKTTTTRSSLIARLSNPRLALIATILLLLSMLIAFYPSLRFVRGVIIGTLHPLAEFDSNEPFEFYDDNPYTTYWLAVQVDDHDAPIPQLDVNIVSTLGEVQTESINRWSSMMGRKYKQFMIVTPPADGRFSINITTESNEDFTIFRRPEDVLKYELNLAAPIWIVAGFPFVCSLFLFGIVVFRLATASNKIDLQIH